MTRKLNKLDKILVMGEYDLLPNPPPIQRYLVLQFYTTPDDKVFFVIAPLLYRCCAGGYP